jgi:hypothetical protein
MNRRFVLQVCALLICMLLIASLTLLALGKVSAMTFWVLLLLAFAVLYLFYKPK